MTVLVVNFCIIWSVPRKVTHTSDMTLNTIFRAGLYHGPWSRTMEDDGMFPWSDFLQNKKYKAFAPLLMCKPHVGQEEWPRTQKRRNALIFSNICPKGALLKLQKESSLTILLSSLVFIFSSPEEISSKFYVNNILPWAPAFFSMRAPLLPLAPQNPLDHASEQYSLLETTNSMVTLTFLSLVWTEVVQGQVQQPITCFTRPWDNFMVHGVNNPLVFPSHRNQRMPSKYLVLKLPSRDNLTSQKMVS